MGFIPLYEEYFQSSTEIEIRKNLYNLITRHDSVVAFDAAIKIIQTLQTKNLDEFELNSCLNYMVRFKNSEIRQKIIDYASSPDAIVRAASYVALRNYPDEEVKTIITNALNNEADINAANNKSELRMPVSESNIDSLIIEILNTTNRQLQKKKTKKIISKVKK